MEVIPALPFFDGAVVLSSPSPTVNLRESPVGASKCGRAQAVSSVHGKKSEGAAHHPFVDGPDNYKILPSF